MQLSKKSIFALSLVFFAASGFSGCGTGNSSAPDSAQKKLLNSDLNELTSYKNGGALQFDQQNDGIFTQIFGGTTGDDLNRFLNDRVHYYIDKDEDVSVTPSDSDFSIKGWTQDQDATENAENIGIEYWIMGLVNRVSVSFNIEGQNVAISSARTGIVLLDDGYAATIQINDQGTKETVDLPSFYRQSILLHEARHSDCTGGLSQRQLSKIRQDQSMAEFSSKEDAGHCGHLHVACPSGDYSGLYACDNETYGAYGVQTVFLTAADTQLGLDGQDQSLADVMEMDAYSRLLNSDHETADMSSTDTIAP